MNYCIDSKTILKIKIRLIVNEISITHISLNVKCQYLCNETINLNSKTSFENIATIYYHLILCIFDKKRSFEDFNFVLYILKTEIFGEWCHTLIIVQMSSNFQDHVIFICILSDPIGFRVWYFFRIITPPNSAKY